MTTTTQPLPDFITWVTQQQGYSDEQLITRIGDDQRLNDAVHEIIGNGKVPKGADLVRTVLLAEQHVGYTYDLQQLQTSYTKAADAYAAVLGSQIGEAQKKGDTQKVEDLQAQANTLGKQMPNGARWGTELQTAIGKATGANTTQTGPNGTIATTTGVGPSTPTSPTTLQAGDLRLQITSAALQNLLTGEANSTGLSRLNLEGIPIAGAGPGITPEQYNLAPDSQNASGPMNFTQNPAHPIGQFGEVQATSDLQTQMIQNEGFANRVASANGAPTNPTQALIPMGQGTIAGIPASGVMTIAQALRVPQQMTDQEYIQFQQNLIAAGLMFGGDPTKILQNQVRWGDRSDPDTIGAWENLIAQSAATGTSIAATLQNKQAAFMPVLKQSVQFSQASTISSLLGPLNLTHPDDIKAAAENAFVTAIGRAPTEEELNQLVGGYHGLEQGAYDSKKAQITAAVNQNNLFAAGPTGLMASGGSVANVGNAGDQFLAVTRQHESGNNYASPTRPGHFASGAYQFMHDTWNGYGGYSDAYLAPPAVQDAKAREYLAGAQSLSNDPRIWALYWYGGPGVAEQAVREGAGFNWNYAPPENGGLTWGQYADYVISHMGGGSPGSIIQNQVSSLPGQQLSGDLTAPTGLNIGPGTPSFAAGLDRAMARDYTTTSAPSVSAYIEEQARTAHPTEYAAKSLGDSYFNLLSLLRGNIPAGGSQ